ncbi:B-cell receptor CD22 [Perca flavescens]|uniref:B-cell receptor CD22 n=1 Tax=Perca flavescens TaxID=8167 RepID=UPI00106E5E8B|nr:B-cell receptor CD22-like [Perca flavescens]
MRGVQHLLLLAVFALLARCQQKPQVSVSPMLNQIFSGDLFFLRCNSSGSSVTWYIDNDKKTITNDTWKIGAASPKHSGNYQCQSESGQKSDNFKINVLDYVPSASLTIKSGQPVVRTDSSVVLQLENEDGLWGWKCCVYSGGPIKKIQLKLSNDSRSVVFQSRRLDVPETVFWCTDKTEQNRSNQITVRTSVKDVSLEMYPLPAVVGESLILKCLAWGTDLISHTVFYKNNEILDNSNRPTYKISNVTESAMGRYRCIATFKHKAYTEGPPYRVVSDDQDVFVQASPMKAFLSANSGLSCSCLRCPDNSSYRWYHKNNGQWAVMDYTQAVMMPKASGTYACRAVWNNGRSSLSIDYVYQSPIPILTGVFIVLAILILAAVGFFIWYKKRNATGRIYEDMPLRSRDEYEKLQKRAQKEGEYDTLNPEAPGRQKKEGEYEALKKEEMTSGEYQTVRMEGAVGGEGGYEALKKEGMKEGVYHTLGMEGEAGGGGDTKH